MQSITQSFTDELFKLLISNKNAENIVDELVAPMVFNPSAVLYSGLVSYTDALCKGISGDLLKRVFEKMDEAFLNSPSRKERYYVKQYRERTIITIFGPVTYKRHEYQDKTTKDPFIYVDRKIGLFKRQRYDIVIYALAYEMYSISNSMIKVGRFLSQLIYPFTLSEERKYMAIPRQTIFNMNNLYKAIKAPEIKREDTPETIYIMADEKYIPLQGESSPEDDPNKRHSEMTKIGVIFTGREEELDKNGNKLKRRRWKLTGKHILAFPDESSNFWERTLDTLSEIFHLDKVKQIYILGDGATWIKSGTRELRTDSIKVKYALDRFHLSQAIHKITKDKEMRKLLIDYAIHSKKDDFKKIVDSIHPEDNRSDEIQSKINYVLNNIRGAAVMHKEVKIGCAMEQAIQHILASNFTSVPKAFGKEHLHTYVNARILQQNQHNMASLFIQAADIANKTNNETGIIDLASEKIDLSFFDNMVSNPYYTVNLDSSTFQEITRF